MKSQRYRDIDVMLKDNQASNKKEKDKNESEEDEVIDDFDYENYEILPLNGVTDEDYGDEKVNYYFFFLNFNFYFYFR